jgi:hypothetical protein
MGTCLPLVAVIRFTGCGIKHVSAISADQTRSMRLTISWRPGKDDEPGAVTAALKALMAGIPLAVDAEPAQ